MASSSAATAAGACASTPSPVTRCPSELLPGHGLSPIIGLKPDLVLKLGAELIVGFKLRLLLGSVLELELQGTLPGELVQAVALDVVRVGEADGPQPLPG